MLYHLIAAVALTLNPDPEAVRLSIDNQTRVMQHAMEQGDAPGYLATVYQGDREFLNEQKYFANDFSKKKPEQVTITVGDLTVGDGSATGKVTWSWTMPGKKAREVVFDARWIGEGDQWLYAGETWERYEAPGVMVLSDPGLEELAKNTVEAFEAVRTKVEADFGLTDAALPKRVQKIKLYNSMKHLQQSICLAYEDGLGGWNEPGESIKILANKNSKVGQLKVLLAHEFGHVATFELGPKSNSMAWWVLEGVAELSAESAVHGRRSEGAVKRWARAGKLAPWDKLADFENCEKQYMGHVYTQGHHMIGYISDTFGRPKLNAWMTAMSGGKTMDEATLETLGRAWASLNDEWRATLPKEGEEEPEAPAPEGPKPTAGDAKPAPAEPMKAPETPK